MALFGLFKKEVLYFPGCYSSAYLKEKIENYKKILKKINLSFTTKSNDSDMICCGGILEEAGYEKQLRKLAKENLEYLNKQEIKKIITSCPRCLKTFKSYNEMLPNFDIKVEFILETVLNAIKDNPSLIKSSYYEQVVYYDSCYLGRYSKIIEEPRELLKLLGYDVLELKNNKEETLCCGACGDLPITNPELGEKIAKEFIKNLLKLKIKKIVTADPQSYNYLRLMLIKLGIKDIKLIEISEIICDSFGIKVSKEEQEEFEEPRSLNQKEQEEASEILREAE